MALLLPSANVVAVQSVRAACPVVSDGDRLAVKQAFARYLALLNAGDSSASACLGPTFAIEAPDAPEFAEILRDPRRSGRILVAHQILLDDGGLQLAIEMEARPLDGASPPRKTIARRTVFFTLRDGKVDVARVALDNFTSLPRSQSPRARPAAQLSFESHLPATVDQPFMTRGKFEDYLRLFGIFDERFVRFYHPDVVFAIAPAAQPLHGRESVLQLYRPLRRTLDEEVLIRALVIDSEQGVMAAEISNTMTARGPVRLPMLRMEAGDRRMGSGVIFYGLKDGKIISLREGS
ncbi:nuclear transport factor 2 family protein [Novosphingobium taihuense]|uniref:nuclear transport factor 2 family protein n=1 Tax=Novosphingobium taihuense TaxID=260085 RepID=UPI0011A60444|nr:nuclear transport factor 2 family protein [Novosphingobium taihuense]